MSKTSSYELFDLIQSLSKSEKRHFKVFSSRHVIGERNKYVKLFDIIDMQSRYDESKILKKLTITKKQLNNRKGYLYALVLRGVRIYHLESTASKKIKKFLEYTEILFTKGLYVQCLKSLTKAKQIAVKYEKHMLIYEILLWEETVFRRMYNIKDLEKYIDKGVKDKKLSLEKITTINKYRDLYSQEYLLSNSEWLSRNAENIKQWNIIASHPLLKNEKLATSYEARALYYYMEGGHFMITGEFERAYYIIKKYIAFIEQHPHQIADDPFYYWLALSHLAFTCNHLGKDKEFISALEKARTIPVKTFDLQNKIFSLSYHLELSHYIKNGQFQKGINLIDEIQKGFKRFGNKIDKHFKLLLHYNISILYFATEDYHSALKWLNIILNDPEKNLRKDIYCLVRILNLVIHFELGNQELLKSAVKSTYRFLHKKKRLFAVETAVLNFIQNKAPKVNTSKELIDALKELRKEIVHITKNDFERKALDYFDIIAWLESKIENCPFAEIVREKIKKY